MLSGLEETEQPDWLIRSTPTLLEHEVLRNAGLELFKLQILKAA